jgi:transcriptional regulator with XRE-family HTH domain
VIAYYQSVFAGFADLGSGAMVNPGGRMARRRINQAPIVRSFAERLRQARTARNMTQADLGEKAGVPASYVSDLEQAKAAPGIDLVARLAEALGTTVADLLGAVVPPGDPREAIRDVLNGLLKDADPDVLAALNSLLPLLRELTTRRD